MFEYTCRPALFFITPPPCVMDKWTISSLNYPVLLKYQMISTLGTQMYVDGIALQCQEWLLQPLNSVRRSQCYIAHASTLALRLIEPGKPNPNAHIESFDERPRANCLNENWFLKLAQARAVIEAWQREYDKKRPKKVLGGPTSTAYAEHPTAKSATVATGL